jgi:hypothetical protein
MEERGRTCNDDDRGRGSFATGMRRRPRCANPRQDDNETRRRRTHTGASIDKEFAEEVARTYHDAGRRRTDGGGGALRVG